MTSRQRWTAPSTGVYHVSDGEPYLVGECSEICLIEGQPDAAMETVLTMATPITFEETFDINDETAAALTSLLAPRPASALLTVALPRPRPCSTCGEPVTAWQAEATGVTITRPELIGRTADGRMVYEPVKQCEFRLQPGTLRAVPCGHRITGDTA